MTILTDQSPLPYYQQLYAILRDQIVSGDWKPGDMLPSEKELIEQYEISRITVRQALEKLVEEGLIYRRRGLGTFVAVPGIEQSLNRIVSFTEDMRRRGLHPGTQVLSAKAVPATVDIAEKLQASPGEELARFERLRLADGEPLSIEISHLVLRLCPGILEHDYAQRPLREELEQRHGIYLVRAQQTIRAVAAGKEIAVQLSVPNNAPLFYIERVSFTEQETPVEFLQLYHRGDRYALYSELRG
jgi:GntR family transcriptional regulator